MTQEKYKTFAEFYPSYLDRHRGTTTRVLHVIGTVLAIIAIGVAIYFRNPFIFLGGIVVAYAFAWAGHLFFEHNRPATFGQPFYSFLADLRMSFEILTGRNPTGTDGTSDEPGATSQE